MSGLLEQLGYLHGLSFAQALKQPNPQMMRKQVTQTVYNLGQLINHYKREFATASQQTTASSVNDLIKFADYLDENGFHALADKVDSVIDLMPKMAADPTVSWAVKQLSDIHGTMQRDTVTHSEDPAFLIKAIRETLHGPFAKVIEVLENHFGVQGASDGKFASINEMLKIADHLDKQGLYDLADIIGESALIIRRAEDYGFYPKQKGMEEREAEKAPVQPPHEGSLSTRYCPDHRGIQAIRIGEHEYQCPIDGKKYNYETGYLNYEGQRVPGGSVAAQTPTTSNYGGIPMRIYDSRSDVLNRLN